MEQRGRWSDTVVVVGVVVVGGHLNGVKRPQKLSSLVLVSLVGC